MQVSPELALAVVAVIELGRRAKVKDWFAVYTIVVSALLGGVAGALNIYSVPNVQTGILLGLMASGAVTLVSKINSNGPSPHEGQ